MISTVAIFLLGVVLALACVRLRRAMLSFSAQEPVDYAHQGPDLDLRTHLVGRRHCHGMIYGPGGRVSSTFQAVLDTKWEGERGTMSETFTFEDGTVMERVWLLEQGEDGAVSAEATDTVGTGRGRLMGNALGLRYDIRLPQSRGGFVVSAVDWMYLQRDGRILNRSQFRKFGILVAELFCVIEPQEGTHA